MRYGQFIKEHGDKKLTLKFSILQFTFWSTWCSFFSFAGMYFIHSGYSYSFVGAAMSVAICCGIAGQVFWGFLCDKLQSIKKVFILANILLLAAILALADPRSPYSVLIFIGFLGFCQTPQPAVLDSWILKKNVNTPLNYGFIRMWASIGFSCFGWIIGISIEGAGYGVMFVFAAAFVAVTLAVSLLVSDCGGGGEGIRLGDLRLSYGRLIKNRRYLLFLAACFLIGFGNQATDNLLSLVVSEVGGGSGDLGMIIFLSAITELPFFFYSARIFSRFSPRQCFWFSCCAYVLEYTIIALAHSTTMVAVGVLFQGIGFSVLLPNLRTFAHDNSPEQMRTSAQTLTDAVFAGLAGMASSAFGAVIIERAGVGVMFGLCAGAAILAMALFLKVTKAGAVSH
ncbi:MFS1 family protein [Anaerobacterium chartisolvens]|uniref:MFS1 family protein n=1 Tax=Anaerobacterium chartisolvens TaxID=1297424 RepID=A0A369B7L1_9FIRM|nr:MFS transporter [Anaerobacterium chartisolvens]RCX16536.1 MFS1 family protein [Anaerobacterium chartisolvens]